MRNDLHANLTVRIFSDRKCFGPGVAELLRRVRELHSLRAAEMMAFISACEPRQISCRSPEGMPSLVRRHPVSKQCGVPLGAPLYPVLMICPSLTITAPT